MAPRKLSEIPDLAVSSLELDSRSASPSSVDLPSYLDSLSLKEREALTHHSPNLTPRDVSPLQARSILMARQSIPTPSTTPGAGSINPTDINMKGVQAAFALLGMAMALLVIWFFFWAKNGGFRWRKNDWDDYKSTVLRRKGPDGKTLSNATKSTKLGGGSVIGSGYTGTMYTDSHRDEGSVTDLTSEAPIIREKQSSRKKYTGDGQRETRKERKLREQMQASWEGEADNDMEAYRHEKPARVGGLNRDSEAFHYGTDYSETSSQAHQSRHEQRKSSSRHASPDKRASRRDFSYGQEDNFSANPSRPTRYHAQATNTPPARAAPAYTESVSDVQSSNTKSYHHPIPGLVAKGNGGYRRDRRDSLDD